MAMFLVCFAAPLAEATRTGLRRTLARTVGVALIAVILHYFLEAGRLGRSLSAVADSSLQQMVFESPAATAVVWRVLGLLLIGSIAFSTRVLARFGALAGTALTFAAFTLTGHTSLDDAHVLPILLWAHLVVVSFWFGALIPLRRVSNAEPSAAAGAVIKRFSAMALWLVPVVFVAGAALAVLLIKSIGALTNTYGLVILIKAAAFGVLMLLASLNKWRFGPALGRGDQAALRGFRRTVTAEYALIAAVLTLTAVLTTFFSPES